MEISVSSCECREQSAFAWASYQVGTYVFELDCRVRVCQMIEHVVRTERQVPSAGVEQDHRRESEVLRSLQYYVALKGQIAAGPLQTERQAVFEESEPGFQIEAVVLRPH